MNTSTACRAELSTKDLKSVVAIADRLTRKSPRKHLSNVSISLNGCAAIAWSNMEFNVETSIPCDHEGEDRTITIPAGDLLKILKGTKAKRIEIMPGDGSTEIPETTFIAGSISRTLSPFVDTESITDIKGKTTVLTSIPEIPRINYEGETINVDAEEFIRAIKAVFHAVDPESSRYALGGVLLSFEAGKMDIVATDGRRLAIREIVSHGDFVGTFNVPHYALKTFIDLLPKKITGSVSLIVSPNRQRIVLVHTDTALETPEVQGRFPRWKDVVPTYNLSTAIIHREELRELMDEACKMQTEENRGFDLKFAVDLLTFKGTGENRQSTGSLPILCPGRVKFTIDPRFVREALDAMESPEILWEFTDGESAMVIRSPIPGIHTEVVMPLSRDR